MDLLSQLDARIEAAAYRVERLAGARGDAGSPYQDFKATSKMPRGSFIKHGGGEGGWFKPKVTAQIRQALGGAKVSAVLTQKAARPLRPVISKSATREKRAQSVVRAIAPKQSGRQWKTFPHGGGYYAPKRGDAAKRARKRADIDPVAMALAAHLSTSKPAHARHHADPISHGQRPPRRIPGPRQVEPNQHSTTERRKQWSSASK